MTNKIMYLTFYAIALVITLSPHAQAPAIAIVSIMFGTGVYLGSVIKELKDKP